MSVDPKSFISGVTERTLKQLQGNPYPPVFNNDGGPVSDVKRYDMLWDQLFPCDCARVESTIGEYVRFDEVKPLLLTPAHAAVIAAAVSAEDALTALAHTEAIYGGQISDDVLSLIETVVALRATTPTEATP